MSEWHWAWMAVSLAAGFCLAAWLGRRGGDEPRDTRLRAGTGAGLGMVGLGLMALHVGA